MKKLLIILGAMLISAAAAVAQDKVDADHLVYVDALDLNVCGRVPADYTGPYHRVNLDAYDFTPGEAKHFKFPAGVFVAFKTNSTVIGIQMTGGITINDVSTPSVAKLGFDLYMHDADGWAYVATKHAGWAMDGSTGLPRENKPTIVRRNMEEGEKDFIMYLPLHMELVGLKIGVTEDAWIKPLKNPFKGNIVLYGSSVCHGTGASRAGTGWSSQVARKTGYNIINLAVAGNCRMSEAASNMLADIKDVDCYIFDTFNNPTIDEIKTRLKPMVNTIRAKHPKTPIIFLSAHRRDLGNYDTSYRSFEHMKHGLVERLLNEIMDNDSNIYYIDIFDITGLDGYAQVDGVHPDGLGYYRWAEEIGPKLVKLFKKFGIK